MRVGYVRSFTEGQSADSQLFDLKSAGCEKIYIDKNHLKTQEQPELIKILDQVEAGDEVVVWRMDRLCNTLSQLVELMNLLSCKGVRFVSLEDNIDTGLHLSIDFVHVFMKLADFENNIIKEKKAKEIINNRKNGKKGGRPRGLGEESENVARTAEQLFKNNLPVEIIARKIGRSKATVYKYLKYRGVLSAV